MSGQRIDLGRILSGEGFNVESAVFKVGEVGDDPAQVTTRIKELIESGALDQKIAEMTAEGQRKRETIARFLFEEDEPEEQYPNTPYADALLECIGREPVVAREGESEDDYNERKTADHRAIYEIIDGLPYLEGWEHAEAYIRIVNTRNLITLYNDTMYYNLLLMQQALTDFYGSSEHPEAISPAEVADPNYFTETGMSIGANMATVAALVKLILAARDGLIYFTHQLNKRHHEAMQRAGGAENQPDTDGTGDGTAGTAEPQTTGATGDPA